MKRRNAAAGVKHIGNQGPVTADATEFVLPGAVWAAPAEALMRMVGVSSQVSCDIWASPSSDPVLILGFIVCRRPIAGNPYLILYYN